MSYPAQRWARAQVLRIGRKPVAIAVLGVIADAYRPDGRVPLNRAAIALRVGVTVDTVAAALKTLAAAGIISYRVIRDDSNVVLGTLYTLHGFTPEEWPEGREGERVMVEQALAAGCEPQPWWPRFRRHLSPENGLEAPPDGDSPREGDSLNYPGTLPLNCRGTLPRSNRGTLSPQSTGTLSPSIRCKTVTKDGSNKTVIEDGNKDGTANAAVGAIAPTSEAENPKASETLFTDPQQEEGSSVAEPKGDQLPPAKEKPKAKGKAQKQPTVPEECRDFFALNGIDPAVALEWLQIRKQKRCPAFGPHAQKLFANECAKDGKTVAEGIDVCIQRCWAGYYPDNRTSARKPTAPRRPTDPQAGLGVCQPPVNPVRMFTPEESAAATAEILKETGWSD